MMMTFEVNSVRNWCGFMWYFVAIYGI